MPVRNRLVEGKLGLGGEPFSPPFFKEAIHVVKLQGSSPKIADIGTGCGAIAISLALNLPQAEVYATDISAPALKVARINCQQHRVAHRVHLLQGDMLHPLPDSVDIIVANLPYIDRHDLSQLSLEILNFEPTLSLFGGWDGLDKVRQLLSQAKDKLRPQGCLLLEVGQGQGGAVNTLAHSHFPDARVEMVKDLNGTDRVIAILPEGLASEVS